MDSKTINALEEQIKTASGPERFRLQPKLAAAMKQLAQDGMRIPARLRNLNERLVQEEMESRFDNLPV